MKEFCRNIDRVTVKGSAKPIKLYTVDLAYERITKNIISKKMTNNEELDSEIKRT